MGIGKILGWLAIFIGGSLIVSFLITPNSFNNFKNNIKSILPSQTGNAVIEKSEIQKDEIINDQLVRPEDYNNKPIEDPLITKCKNSFNNCKDITETKHDELDVSLLKIAKFTDVDINDSKVFYNTWQDNGPIMSSFGNNFLFNLGFHYDEFDFSKENSVKINNILPFVLIAVKVSRTNNIEGQASSGIVIGCDKNGELTNKMILYCG